MMTGLSLTEIKGWRVAVSEDGDTLTLSRDGAPGTIHVKADDEGFVADIMSSDDDPTLAASAWATYAELEGE